ncbi:MobV family relaxase [Streptococcus equinus]|uniref:MobV family relaxase n=1 Tax=Streptococcus equinus TaxID=1335 RepID=UPI003BF7E1A8
MSYIVARMEKMKVGNLGGAYRHNERIFKNHSNKDIDPNRSHLNYELTDRDRSVSYEKQIKNYVNETKISKRAIRKDAVLCDEWVITSDKKFFEDLNQEQVQEFFETAKKYFEEQYGKQNIAYASVHLDESTPHMHMGVVPMKDGKLSSKAMFDREELKSIQDKLPKYMNEHGFEVERGELNSEKKHKTVAEFKQDMAVKELDEKLVSEYGAPVYINETTGEFVTEGEYQENYKDFKETFGEYNVTEDDFKDFLDSDDIPLRKVTVQEKMDWVKQHYQQALNKLESSQKLSEARISELDQRIEEKTKELSKIDLKASKGASRVSQLENAIDSRSDALAAVKRDFKAYQAFLKRGEQIADNWRQEITGELKKTAFGKEYIRMDPEVFEKARMSNHWFQVKQDSLRQEIRRLETDLENSNRARFKLLDENKELKAESKWLREDNKKLFERLDITTKKLKLWRDKTRKLLPKKEFKAITAVVNTEIIEIMTPVAKVVKAVTKTIKKMTL